MKKSLYSIFALIAMLVAFTSCEKDEVENTATVEMAGEWHVHVSALVGGEEVDDNWFGDGDYNITTSNRTASVTAYPAEEVAVSAPDMLVFSAGSYSTMAYDGKVTLPLLYALDAGSDAERQDMLAIVARREKSAAAFQQVLKFVESRGGFERAREEARSRIVLACRNLEQFEDSEARRSLADLAHSLVERDF